MRGAGSRRVLIAGVGGFIGSHLARHVLAEGHDVVGLVRPGSPRDRLTSVTGRMAIVEVDLGDHAALASAVAEAQPEIGVDAAWSHLQGQAGSTGHVASLRNALRLAELLARGGCPRYVHAGTCFEYALSDGLVSEASPTTPHTLYGACKLAASIAVGMLGRTTGMAVAWPRIFYVYGPHEAPHRLVPTVACGLLRGQPTPTTTGDQVRDYMHVEDVAAALWAIAVSRHEGPVNVATGRHVPVRRVVELIGDLVGRRDLLRIGALPARPEEPAAIRASIAGLSDLGWRPRYSLDEGLRQTVDWWRHRLEGDVPPSAVTRAPEAPESE